MHVLNNINMHLTTIGWNDPQNNVLNIDDNILKIFLNASYIITCNDHSII